MIEPRGNPIPSGLPGWVPEAARAYLAHTEAGVPIRELARLGGCHASTVSRQVRRIENRRDDPLIDAALKRLSVEDRGGQVSEWKRTKDSMTAFSDSPGALDEKTLTREARRVLRKLCETGAVLAVAAEMDKAVVVRDTGEGGSSRTAVVDSAVAQAMALKDWIACDEPGRISRYHITPTGRAALNKLLAEQESRVRGFAEAQAGFETGRAAEAALDEIDRDPRARKGRYTLVESPLTALARRRDKSGAPFLTEALMAAGERLREDFELSRIGPAAPQDWDAFVTSAMATPADGQSDKSDARARLQAALRDLGPGLGDVALRCCCYLEGLEKAEQDLGWAARSGKIVLRIALQRLRRHYDELARQGGDLIG